MFENILTAMSPPQYPSNGIGHITQLSHLAFQLAFFFVHSACESFPKKLYLLVKEIRPGLAVLRKMNGFLWLMPSEVSYLFGVRNWNLSETYGSKVIVSHMLQMHIFILCLFSVWALNIWTTFEGQAPTKFHWLIFFKCSVSFQLVFCYTYGIYQIWYLFFKLRWYLVYQFEE